jgi:hypothetical protein
MEDDSKYIEHLTHCEGFYTTGQCGFGMVFKKCTKFDVDSVDVKYVIETLNQPWNGLMKYLLEKVFCEHGWKIAKQIIEEKYNIKWNEEPK